MLIAGEASGDLLAAELVSALLAASKQSGDGCAPRFFGAGGPRMAEAGVDLAFDLTQHAVIGIPSVKQYFELRRMFNQLLALAIERKPDAVIGVDFGGFNLRFGHAVRQCVRQHPGAWNPKIIQFVSPQVWASRPGRANRLAADYDLVLSIIPFEKDWYAQHAPGLRVEFVGHPMVERLASVGTRCSASAGARRRIPTILLLPGSRVDELRRHLLVMIETARIIKSKTQAKFTMVLPDAELCALAQGMSQTNVKRELAEPVFSPDSHPVIKGEVGNLPQALMQADLAIASTGTVTMECAFFGVPAVTLYKTSWFTYEIARRIATVKWATMPNILAEEEIYPEFIQGDAIPENIAGTALELLQNESRRQKIQTQLAKIVSLLGEPGASTRAAAAILSLF